MASNFKTDTEGRIEFVGSTRDVPAPATRTGALAASTSEDVLDTTTGVIIDYIEWVVQDAGTPVEDIELTISRYDAAGTANPIKTSSLAASQLLDYFTMGNLNTDLQHLFVLDRYQGGGSSNQNIAHLREALYCPFGVKITLENTGVGSLNTSIVIGYSTLY